VCECTRTPDVESYVIRVAVVLRTDLTAVHSLIGWPYVLDRQSPFGRPLIVVDGYPRIRSELEQADRQRMYVITFPPRDLCNTRHNGERGLIWFIEHAVGLSISLRVDIICSMISPTGLCVLYI